jgi:hypothetical protein
MVLKILTKGNWVPYLLKYPVFCADLTKIHHFPIKKRREWDVLWGACGDIKLAQQNVDRTIVWDSMFRPFEKFTCCVIVSLLVFVYCFELEKEETKISNLPQADNNNHL